jgi:hypothetical protein
MITRTHIPRKLPLKDFVGLGATRGNDAGQDEEREEGSDWPKIHGRSLGAGAKEIRRPAVWCRFKSGTGP